MSLGMWEIFVPKRDNDGTKFPVEHHQEWDAMVTDIAGGQTLLAVARGRWIDKVTGQLFDEEVIPVRIACTGDQINEIARRTAVHYGQLAVLAYLLSSDVRIYEASDEPLDAPKEPA